MAIWFCSRIGRALPKNKKYHRLEIRFVFFGWKLHHLLLSSPVDLAIIESKIKERLFNLMVIMSLYLVWHLIQVTPTHFLVPAATGSSVCQGRTYCHSFDVIAEVRGTAQAQSRGQVFCHQHHRLPFLSQIGTVYPGRKEPDNARKSILLTRMRGFQKYPIWE